MLKFTVEGKLVNCDIEESLAHFFAKEEEKTDGWDANVYKRCHFFVEHEDTLGEKQTVVIVALNELATFVEKIELGSTISVTGILESMNFEDEEKQWATFFAVDVKVCEE